MVKIMVLLVLVMSFVLVGCNNEKNETKVVEKSAVKTIDLSSNNKLSDEDHRYALFAQLYNGMTKEEFNPDSALRFLNKLYGGKVTMIKETGRGNIVHRFGNLNIITLIDDVTIKTLPSIDKLEGKYQEALYFIGESEQPHFMLKYNTLWFTTGRLNDSMHRDFASKNTNGKASEMMVGIHAYTFRSHYDKMDTILNKAAVVKFKNNILEVIKKL